MRYAGVRAKGFAQLKHNLADLLADLACQFSVWFQCQGHASQKGSRAEGSSDCFVAMAFRFRREGDRIKHRVHMERALAQMPQKNSSADSVDNSVDIS